MPRTKGSKNRVTASTDFDVQIAKLQKDKAMLEEGLSKTVTHIEELKTDIKSLRESLKPQKAEIKQTEKEIAKLETKKAATVAKAAEAAKKVEAEAVLKKLLASTVPLMQSPVARIAFFSCWRPAPVRPIRRSRLSIAFGNPAERKRFCSWLTVISSLTRPCSRTSSRLQRS